ncbi:MAG: sulfatase-like hydrolase/transferase [Cyclobacteriaceae bacterium]
MKIRNLFLPAIIILPSLLVYGFWSLETDQFELPEYRQLTEGKKNFLKQAVDSVYTESPNILWIVVDDLSIADTDLYADGPVSVPNLKRLANEGVLFTNAYVSSPVCSPSRAAIATGRYNQWFGFEHQLHERYLRNRLEYYAFRYFMDTGPWIPQFPDSVPDEDFIEQIGIPTSEIMLPEVLEKYGYNSAYIGKWHIGKQEKSGPQAFGFDHFYGFMASHTLYIPEGTPGFTDQKIEDDFTDKYIWEGQRDGLHAIQKNGEFIEESRYLTKAITDEAIAYINDSDGPFYLWTAYNAPHTPLQAPEAHTEQFSHIEDPVKRVHYAMIKCLDDEVGRLIDHIDKKGLAEETLIMFISDNGGAEYNLTTNNGKYQGGKITNFEGGVKVPMIMRLPGLLEGNQTFQYPVHATDLFVTSAAVANASLPSDRPYAGADLIASIRENRPPHDYIYFQMGFNRAVRNDRWKMAWNEDNGDTVLFDLQADPFEQTNYYGENPKAVHDLRTAFDKWSEKTHPRSWPSVMLYTYTADDESVYYFDE